MIRPARDETSPAPWPIGRAAPTRPRNRDQRLAPPRHRRVSGAIQPGAGIEHIATIARKTSRSECANACAARSSARRNRGLVRSQLRERLGMLARRRAQSLQRVGAPAQLLQDRVVGDRAQFARMTNRRRAAGIRLPGARARAGLVEQRRPEGPQQRRVSGILDEVAHGIADQGEEIGGEVGILVDRVGRPVRCGEGVGGDPRDDRQGKLGAAHQHVAVTALDRAFLAQRDRCVGEGFAASGR